MSTTTNSSANKTNGKKTVFTFDDILEQYHYVDDTYIEKYKSKFSKAIGKYIIEFSALENELNESIANTMCDDCHSVGFFLIYKFSYSQKVEFFYTHCNILLSHSNNVPKYYKQRLSKIRNLLNEMGSFRNIIAHSNWQTLDKDNMIESKIELDNNSFDIQFKKIQITPDIIEKEIDKINKIVSILSTYARMLLSKVYV